MGTLGKLGERKLWKLEYHTGSVSLVSEFFPTSFSKGH